MSSDEEAIWAAVLAAEDQHGEAAEDHARGEAEAARVSGDMPQAAIWDAAARTLHVLHSINRTRARSRPVPPLSSSPDCGG